ncbi:MAG: ABC transporter ATP-binding protein [Bdellovibrionales bacterium]|nr:ABC transporter ATP-binding protein [Bdellovibrionales bacterium]
MNYNKELTTAIIKVRGLTKTYQNGQIETPVLKGIDLDIAPGEFVAIMGKSGAGKSTLMYQMSLLDRPTSGSISVDGEDILSMNETERTQFRLNELGYVFQDYALVPELSALENVAIPMLMQGKESSIAYQMSQEILDAIGMEGKYHNRPNQLSGGEQQRVSIARGVAQQPKILFADEPTANLDSASSDAVIETLKKLHDQGQTIIMVTHEPEYTIYCDRIIFLEDGMITNYDYQLE